MTERLRDRTQRDETANIRVIQGLCITYAYVYSLSVQYRLLSPAALNSPSCINEET